MSFTVKDVEDVQEFVPSATIPSASPSTPPFLRGMMNSASSNHQVDEEEFDEFLNPYSNNRYYAEGQGPGAFDLTQAMERVSMVEGQPYPAYYGMEQPNYFYQQQMTFTPPMPLQYHLYPPPMSYNQSNRRPHFISEWLRVELQRRNEACFRVLDPNCTSSISKCLTHKAPEAKSLPEELNSYHTFYPLDQTRDKSTKIFGYPSSTYRVTSAKDGMYYVLRRIEGFGLANESSIHIIEPWRQIHHPNIVSVREAFTTKAFRDSSLVFVYDYHPNAVTLHQQHFSVQAMTQGANRIPESTLWNYITQLVSAIKTIHSAGLACRVMEPTKILVTGKDRIRLNCCGIIDMISYDGVGTILHYQQDDLLQLGHLILALACGTLAALQNIPHSLQVASSAVPDLKGLLLYLLRPQSMKTIDDVIAIIANRIVMGYSAVQQYNDFVEEELSRELENSRLTRLMCKLGFINERPEFAKDPKWSETGDRYLLKLFRDYVFHQVDSNGKPILDIGHVVTCLNKLDVGVDEKIMLMSRDEQSCLIVSYRELKKCVEDAFNELKT